MKIGYTRAAQGKSTDEALSALKQYGCEVIFQDTGPRNADKKWPQLEVAIHSAQRGDMLVVYQFVDLGTSSGGIFKLISELHSDGVAFASNQEQLDTTTATGSFLPKLAGQFAATEKRLAVERAETSMLALKLSGNLGGRPPVDKSIFEKGQELVNKGFSVRAAAAEIGTSQATLYRHLSKLPNKSPEK